MGVIGRFCSHAGIVPFGSAGFGAEIGDKVHNARLTPSEKKYSLIQGLAGAPQAREYEYSNSSLLHPQPRRVELTA